MYRKRLLNIITLKIILLLTFISINLNVFANDIFPWTYKRNIGDLRMQTMVSAANLYSDRINETFFLWNGISLPRISGNTYTPNNNSLGYEIEVKAQPLTGTTLAYCRIYTRHWWGNRTRDIELYTGQIDFAEIVLDSRNDSNDRLINQAHERQRKTITHEIGHALALDHPAALSIYAIMQQGYGPYPNATLTIQQYDRNNLITKWAN